MSFLCKFSIDFTNLFLEKYAIHPTVPLVMMPPGQGLYKFKDKALPMTNIGNFFSIALADAHLFRRCLLCFSPTHSCFFEKEGFSLLDLIKQVKFIYIIDLVWLTFWQDGWWCGLFPWCYSLAHIFTRWLVTWSFLMVPPFQLNMPLLYQKWFWWYVISFVPTVLPAIWSMKIFSFEK